VGDDFWNCPVYEITKEDKKIYVKDINLGEGIPFLHYNCPKNCFDGEPDYPVNLEQYDSIQVFSSKEFELPDNIKIFKKNIDI